MTIESAGIPLPPEGEHVEPEVIFGVFGEGQQLVQANIVEGDLSVDRSVAYLNQHPAFQPETESALLKGAAGRRKQALNESGIRNALEPYFGDAINYIAVGPKGVSVVSVSEPSADSTDWSFAGDPDFLMRIETHVGWPFSMMDNKQGQVKE